LIAPIFISPEHQQEENKETVRELYEVEKITSEAIACR